MKSKILVVIMLISVLLSAWVAFGRIKVEQASPNVEIVLDWPTFLDLQKAIKEPPTQLLEKFKGFGVQSIAIYEKTLTDFAESNELAMLQGQELISEFYLSGGANTQLFSSLYHGPADLNNLYLFFQEKNTYEKINQQISALPGNLVKYTYTDPAKGFYVLGIDNSSGGMEDLPLGFSDKEIEMATSMGFKIVPRISDTRERLSLLKDTLLDIQKKAQISQIIFEGDRVLGYPDKLDVVAGTLKELGIKVGMIEPFIATQDGINQLAVKNDLNIVRVHSFKAAEMEEYSFGKVFDRYIRAVKERNIRVLYYKPFIAGKAGETNPMILNKKMLLELESDLTKSGYKLGYAEPFPNERGSIGVIALICLGVIAAGLLLLGRFITIPDLLAYGLLILGLLGALGLSLKGYVVLVRDLSALAAGIILPTLAIIEVYEAAKKVPQKTHRRGITAMVLFLRMTAITLAGVLFVIGLLSDVRYIYQINQFRGIKFTFIIPLLLVILYFLKEHLAKNGISGIAEVGRRGITLLNQPVRYSHVIALAIIAVAGLVYIMRTGNQPLLPVSGLEMKIRDFLEHVFVFRPRFKEFAVGHPFMILALYYLLRGERKYLLPLFVIGSVGQLTVLNTFSHIHTPLVVSLVRVFSSMVLGILIGFMLIWIYRKLETIIAKYGRLSHE